MHIEDASYNIEKTSNPDRYDSSPMMLWHWITLGLIVTLSFFLNFFQLQQFGSSFSWPYYVATVRSMLLNWKNFFSLSFDANGFVSVDKPPLDLWLQAASAKVFGFSGWSLILPQALAGVLSVIVLFLLVRRLCGPSAGLLAAIILATTPISVKESRSNNIDMMVVLFVLLASYALHRAVTAGKLSWLLLSAALVGLAFNTKGLEAYLVIPAFGLFYLLSSPQGWKVRFIHLALALVVLLTISFAWVIAVDLTPAKLRPYVGSSQTNSEWELMLGYNGINRLVNTAPSPNSSKSKQSHKKLSLFTYNTPTYFNNSYIYKSTISKKKSVKSFIEPGAPGLFRLFNDALGGYIAWLLPLAIIGLLALGWRKRIRLPLDHQQQAGAFWGMWLVTMFIFFSVAYSFHDYYLVMLTPAIAALSGCGLVSMWNDYRELPTSDWRSWALPVALSLTAIAQISLFSQYPGWYDWGNWLLPLVLDLSLIATVLLVSIRLIQGWQMQVHIVQRVALIGAILSLLLTPLTWSGIITISAAKEGYLLAGPKTSYIPLNLLFTQQRNATKPILSDSQSKLVNYLQAHRGHTRFLLATIDASSNSLAAPVIMATGEPVMAMGGFNGHDPILTVPALKKLIADGTIRFFWLPAIYQFNKQASNAPSHPLKLVSHSKTALKKYRQNSALIQWVNAHCKPIPAFKQTDGSISDRLFDCS